MKAAKEDIKKTEAAGNKKLNDTEALIKEEESKLKKIEMAANDKARTAADAAAALAQNNEVDDCEIEDMLSQVN